MTSTAPSTSKSNEPAGPSQHKKARRAAEALQSIATSQQPVPIAPQPASPPTGVLYQPQLKYWTIDWAAIDKARHGTGSIIPQHWWLKWAKIFMRRLVEDIELGGDNAGRHSRIHSLRDQYETAVVWIHQHINHDGTFKGADCVWHTKCPWLDKFPDPFMHTPTAQLPTTDEPGIYAMRLPQDATPSPCMARLSPQFLLMTTHAQAMVEKVAKYFETRSMTKGVSKVCRDMQVIQDRLYRGNKRFY